MTTPVSSGPTRPATTYAAVVGQVLARKRTDLGLSQAALAQQIGVAQSVVSRVESGALPLTIVTLARWSDALGIRPAQVLTQAHDSIAALQAQGFEVLYEAPPAPKPASASNNDGAKVLLGAAAVGALIALALATKE